MAAKAADEVLLTGTVSKNEVCLGIYRPVASLVHNEKPVLEHATGQFRIWFSEAAAHGPAWYIGGAEEGQWGGLAAFMYALSDAALPHLVDAGTWYVLGAPAPGLRCISTVAHADEVGSLLREESASHSIELSGKTPKNSVCLGAYKLLPEEAHHGRGVYEHDSGGFRLWWINGRWVVGDAGEWGGTAAYLQVVDAATLPEEITSAWEALGTPAPLLKCVSAASHALELAALRSGALETLYLCGRVPSNIVALGSYKKVDGLVHEGRYVYEHEGGKKRLWWSAAAAQGGAWYVGEAEAWGGLVGCFTAVDESYMPERIHGGTWSVFHAGNWEAAPTVTCLGAPMLPPSTRAPSMFLDEDFPPVTTALALCNTLERNSRAGYAAETASKADCWIRVKNLGSPGEPMCLYRASNEGGAGPDPVAPGDIVQGSLGECVWLHVPQY